MSTRIISFIVLIVIGIGIYKGMQWWHSWTTPTQAQAQTQTQTQPRTPPQTPSADPGQAANTDPPPPPAAPSQPRTRLSLRQMLEEGGWLHHNGLNPFSGRKAAAAVGVKYDDDNQQPIEIHPFAQNDPATPAAPAAPTKQPPPTVVEAPTQQIVIRILPPLVYEAPRERPRQISHPNYRRYCRRMEDGWCCPDGFHPDAETMANMGW